MTTIVVPAPGVAPGFFALLILHAQIFGAKRDSVAASAAARGGNLQRQRIFGYTAVDSNFVPRAETI